MSIRAARKIHELFEFFLNCTENMGKNARKAIDSEGLHRTVCDYIAGMTDRYLIEQHQRWCGPG